MTAAPTERARILLVDDSMLMRKAASKMLGEEFEVITASDGEDAWERIQADSSIQVVFTDLMMPRMDGYGLLQAIRGAEDPGTLNLPVIVVTGAENDESARKKALDQGATDFITKPFSSVDLLARARAHANYRRITRHLEQQITLDALTGLANKSGFLDRLQQDIAYARRHAQPLSLVRIEIDDFRNLFLAHGKARAELLVQHVAQQLRDCVRKEDTAARIGLASFAAALPAGQHVGSKAHIERLRKQIAATPVIADGKPIAITVSAAVDTPALPHSLTALAALEACEPLVQAAIRAGGDRVVGHAPHAGEHAAPMTTRTEPAKAPDAAIAAVSTKPPQPGAAPEASATAAAPPSAPSAPAPAAAPPAVNSLDSIDAALHRIDHGEGQSVVVQLPQLIKRLMPMLRLLSDKQRAGLIAYLQKLGPN
jgi:two-component system cell cycle response regulator